MIPDEESKNTDPKSLIPFVMIYISDASQPEVKNENQISSSE
jgi:hypothetical protein